MAATARWEPILAAGVVEHLVAAATEGLRRDDREGNAAWFLQVEPDRILCVWDWTEKPTNHLEMDLIPGDSPTLLKVMWTGETLSLTGARRFQADERQPRQGEVIVGALKDLDRLLREPRVGEVTE